VLSTFAHVYIAFYGCAYSVLVGNQNGCGNSKRDTVSFVSNSYGRMVSLINDKSKVVWCGSLSRTLIAQHHHQNDTEV